MASPVFQLQQVYTVAADRTGPFSDADPDSYATSPIYGGGGSGITHHTTSGQWYSGSGGASGSGWDPANPSVTEEGEYSTLSPNQYTKVVIGADAVTLAWYSPGAVVRADFGGSGDFYLATPTDYSGTTDIWEISSGTPTQLATGGGATPSTGDTLELAVHGKYLAAGINGIADVVVTDTTHTAGECGIYESNAFGDQGRAIEFGTVIVHRIHPLLQKVKGHLNMITSKPTQRKLAIRNYRR